MRIGVPAEVKADEFRVGLTPAGVRELVDRGHDVVVEAGAGSGSELADGDYAAQGARILADGHAVFAEADLIVKVKEPQPDEVARLRPGQALFAYLHLAADPALTRSLLESGATCIAYETVRDDCGRLPLLAPMSEIAGKIAAQAGAFMLERPLGGRGVLLGGVAGVAPGRVMVIGGGTAGKAAAEVAAGLGGEVYVYDRDIERLRELDRSLGGRCSMCFASVVALEARLPEVDLVIGAVLVAGARAPRVLTRRHLSLLRRQAVLVDVSIDQGGCFETSRPTTHSDPTYSVDGITHYCVANMPGAVPVTATCALTNSTLPYVVRLAEHGPREALLRDRGLRAGLNVAAGMVASEVVATEVGLDYTPPDAALELIAA
jgi:alanine dehydrogenase